MTSASQCRHHQSRQGLFCRFEVAAQESQISGVIQRVGVFLQRHGCPEQHGLSVVLRELLSNAIHHGNQSRSALKVRGEMTLGDDQITLWVEDEGDGFDFQRLDLTLPADPPQGSERRGLILVRALVSELKFNGPGNRVTVELQIERERGR